jgi:hypothetical protein
MLEILHEVSMTIRVLSFDFDGCLFHRDYNHSEEKDVVRSNRDFLNKIKTDNSTFTFTQVYTFVGSARQSKKIDGGGKGSCLPAIEQVSEHLGTTLDTFLLADIFGNLPDGTSFARAKDKDYRENSDWLFDESKVTIMYAPMHKIANKHSDEEIILDFYDDKSNCKHPNPKYGELLERLADFYAYYSHLIPANVTLRLHHYAGQEVTPITAIEGTGFIDANYRQTVKDLSQQAVNVAFNANNVAFNANNVALNAKPEALQNRKDLSAHPVIDLVVGRSR